VTQRLRRALRRIERLPGPQSGWRYSEALTNCRRMPRFVIPSEARNLSSMKTQEEEGFLAPARPGLGMTGCGVFRHPAIGLGRMECTRLFRGLLFGESAEAYRVSFRVARYTDKCITSEWAVIQAQSREALLIGCQRGHFYV
jgi:hypothetical protein